MNRTKVGGELLQTLAGARDPLMKEPFRAGDDVAQCPRCTSWMLVSSWELMGRCACSYKPNDNDRLDLRRGRGTTTETGGTQQQTGTDTGGGGRFGWVPLLVGIVLVLGLILYVASRPSPTPTPTPAPTPSPRPNPSPPPSPPPRPQPWSGETVTTFENWEMVETRSTPGAAPSQCVVRTESELTSDRYMSLRVTPDNRVGMIANDYNWDYPVWLRIDNATQAYDLHSQTQSLSTVIGWFRAGYFAYVSATEFGGGTATDRYSLSGFTDAYAAALNACIR